MVPPPTPNLHLQYDLQLFTFDFTPLLTQRTYDRLHGDLTIPTISLAHGSWT